jgi:hypothetical protein
MGWQQTTVYSHASRLVRAGLAARQAMSHGEGVLLYATRTGVKMAGVPAAALAGPPAPTTWAHCEACAWTGAWLTARGRHMVGPRELLVDVRWRGELHWTERGATRRCGHRPDLAGGVVRGRGLIAIEVELAVKSTARLRAILGLHARWIASGQSAAVIYVCGSEAVAAHVRRQAATAGLRPVEKTLRTELLETIRADAAAARARAETGSVGAGSNQAC